MNIQPKIGLKVIAFRPNTYLRTYGNNEVHTSIKYLGVTGFSIRGLSKCFFDNITHKCKFCDAKILKINL